MDKVSKVKWKNVPVSDMINMRTDPVGDLIDGTMIRLDTVASGRLQAFMEGQIDKAPDQVFLTDLRTAVNALSSLRKHF